MMEIPINLPRVILRAATPIKAGNDLILSGELQIGNRGKVHIVTTMPFVDAQREWERLTGWAASRPGLPYRTARVRRDVPQLGDVLTDSGAMLAYDETQGVFDDIAKFMSKSPIGKVAKQALSFVPYVNVASNAAFMAADIYNKARGGRGKPRQPMRTALANAQKLLARQNAQRVAQGKSPLPIAEKDLVRAAKAQELVNRARHGNPDAQRVIGRMRTASYAPGDSSHVDQLALDAATLLEDGTPLDADYDDVPDADEAAGDVDEVAGFERDHRGLLVPRMPRLTSAKALTEALEAR